MISMEKQIAIKKEIDIGIPHSTIARKFNVNRKTVSKISKKIIEPKIPFKKKRNSKYKILEEAVCNLLICTISITSKERRLTAARIHVMILDGTLDDNLPPMNVSIRTVERLVRSMRDKLRIENNAQHHQGVHDPGGAQLDFGEVSIVLNRETCKIYILVMTLPYSNYRLAQITPAQNFECLAEALINMFEFLGCVPNTMRCDNMSTAVVKIVNRSNINNEHNVWDPVDHPRILTENFQCLMKHYNFTAEFCNPASGHEKGSVENAVKWFRENFFTPVREFNGNYNEFNSKLFDFCEKSSKQLHYKHKEDNDKKTVEELFHEERKFMKPLPTIRFSAFSWAKTVADKVCRISIETNTYQGPFFPGQKVIVKKMWNTLEFYNEQGELLGSAPRHYSRRKDYVDWKTETKVLQGRPSAFKNSIFSKVLTPSVCSWLLRKSAPDRIPFFRACHGMLAASVTIDDVCNRFDDAVREYGGCSNDIVVNALRGNRDQKTDDVQPLKMPDYLPDQSLPAPKMGNYAQGNNGDTRE